MGNPDSALQKTARVMKQAEKVGNGIHELTGVAGFFHPYGSIAHGSISLGLALGNYMNAGIHGYAAMYYRITGDDEEERRERKIMDKSLHNMGENLKDVAWDAVFLIPFTKILAKLGKVLKLANKLLSFVKKIEKFASKVEKISKLAKTSAKLKEKCAVLEKRLIALIDKEYGPIASECLKNFKKWTFPSYAETIKKWKQTGKADPHEVAEFIQSIIGQIKFICDSIGKAFAEFEKMVPDWLRKDADKEMDKIFAEMDELEKELEKVSEEEEESENTIEEEEEYEEVYIKGPEEKYYAMNDKELNDSIRQSRRDKKNAEARAEEADEARAKYQKNADKYAREEADAQKRMDKAQNKKISANEEAAIAGGAEDYYQSLADSTTDEKKKADYQKKANEAAKKKERAEKKAEQADKDLAQASTDKDNATMGREMAESYVDLYEGRKQQAEDDAWMAQHEKELAKKEKQDRVGADERIAANEEITLLEAQLDIYKRKYNQAKSDEFTAVINGWGQKDINDAKKDAAKWKGKMDEVQRKINALKPKAKK